MTPQPPEKITLTDETSQLTQEIYKDQYYWLQDKINQVNKKAAKLKTPPVIMTTGPERLAKIPADERTPYERTKVYIEVTIKYQIPVIEGYRLVCRFELEQIENANSLHTNIFTYTTPGQILPAAAQVKTEIHCDHCGHQRRRKQSFLMQNIKTGQYKEVGTTCLKDFFGHDPARFVFMASLDPQQLFNDAQEDDDREAYGQYRGIEVFDAWTFLTMAAACIDSFGWTSRAVALCDLYNYKPATADTTLDMLCNWHKIKKENRPEITSAHRELAQKTVDYFEDLDTENNDYKTNCKKIAARRYVSPKTAGYAASMIISYRMHVKRQLGEEEKANRPPSNYIGTQGQRLTVKANCIFRTTLNTQYGTTTLYFFIDDQGNKIKTFYSGSTWTLEQGDTATITGTIKDLETYKGEKITVLNRCKVK